MSDFIRRMLSSSLIARRPDDEGGSGSPQDAGVVAAEPAAGATASEAGTAEATPDASGTESSPAATAGDGTTPAAASPQAPDRAQQRMNQLVAERWAERRRAEEAEQRNRLLQEQLNQTREALTPTVDAQGNPTPPATPAPARREAPQDLQAMAAQIAAQNDFNRQVSDEVARGRDPARGGHADFDQVASNLQRFGELPRTFVEAALATGKGAEVMYHLGGDIAEADRILSMPPIQQAVALATLAQSIKPTVAKTVTSAPNPVSPKVGGGKTTNTPTLEDENMSTEAWIALREKQLAAKKSEARAARR